MVGLQEHSGDLFLLARSSSIVRVATILYADPNLEFRILLDAFAIDMIKQKNKFEIYYQLYSNKLNRSVFIVVDVGEFEAISSLSIVFKNVSWYEREIFDMFGIMFSGHPDMRRILISSATDKFPLKKGIEKYQV